MAENFVERRAPGVRSRVAWGAIFAGMLVAMALFLLLGSLTAAIDLSLADESSDWATRWVFTLSIVAMFVGGWTTSRLADGESSAEAAFFGIIMWSLTALALLYFAVNGILVFGSGTLLGQQGESEALFPLSRRAAWLSFGGVAASLGATMLGAVLGAPTGIVARVRRPRRKTTTRLEANHST